MLKTALVVALTFTSLSALVAEESQAVDKKDVPAAVVTAFEKAYPDANVTAIDEEMIGDSVAYVFEIREGEKEKDIAYRADGTLHAIAEDIAVAELPQAVVDAVKQAHPKGVIDEADRITRGAATEYEVVVEVVEGEAETEYEIIAASDGKIIDQAQLSDDNDDDTEDEDEAGDSMEDDAEDAE